MPTVPGYSKDIVNVKFKVGTDLSNPDLLLPSSIKSQIISIEPLVDPALLDSIDTKKKGNSNVMRRWFTIKLKPETNSVMFLKNVKNLENVEGVESAPLPQPLP